tara:strand:+ start:2325 stop:3332 length:1008 start_codon:yes stop_codon:yes gene_type:complete
MDYKQYKIQDFLGDEYFVSWVIDGDPSATHFWEKWLRANPEKRLEVERAKELIKSVNYKHTDRLTDAEYSQIFERLLRTDGFATTRSGKGSYRYAYRIAATVVLLIVALIGYQEIQQPAEELVVQQVEISTEFGQRKTIKLPDGSVVKLNIGSSLEFPERFEGNTRTVKLTGEGYFEVAENKVKPFIIQTGGLLTEVLGTSFNLCAYTELDSITVAVVTGRVKISNESGLHQVLSPADMGIYSKQTQSIHKSKYDEDDLAWYSGTLIIENKPLPEVFRQLERWYGVEFEMAENMSLDGTYSGRYHNKSLELILEGIRTTSHINYTINNKKILIYE